MAEGQIVLGHLTETGFSDPEGQRQPRGLAEDWLAARIAGFAPDLIVVCDWRAPEAERLARLAQAQGAPILLVADPEFVQRTRRGAPNGRANALMAAADLAHVETKEAAAHLARAGLMADVLAGPFAAALARGLGQAAPGSGGLLHG